MAPPAKALRVAVIVATKGRADLVGRLVAQLRHQTAQPDILIIAACEPADVAGIDERNPDVQVVFSAPGLPRQRNAGLAALPPATDIIVFFDDDFIPSRYWIARTREIVAKHADIAALTGRVLADGIKTAGLPWSDGAQIVARADAQPAAGAPVMRANVSPYGCNMAFRAAAIAGMRFDERLVLYGWQEDTDFGARAARHGRLVWTDALCGVHLGIKRGRVPGQKLGYSQIINPRYLVAKGTMPASAAIRLAARNVLANAVLSLRPEPYIDRAGRLRGNLLGLRDLITGKWYPERAAEL